VEYIGVSQRLSALSRSFHFGVTVEFSNTNITIRLLCVLSSPSKQVDLVNTRIIWPSELMRQEELQAPSLMYKLECLS